jgi:hypothetical protein
MVRGITWAVVMFSSAAGIAQAGLITFTSASAFDSAITSPTTFGFGGVAPSGSFTPFTTYNSNGVAFTPVGVTVVDVTSANYYVSPVYPADFIVNGTASSTPAGMLLTLLSPVTAIGFELGSLDGGAITAAFSTGDSAILDPSPTLGNVTFWGFTSTTPFSSVSLENSDLTPAVYVTSVTLAGAGSTTTPEPATAVLFGLGLITCAIFRRFGR